MGTMFPRKLLFFSEIILAHHSRGLHSLLHLLPQQLFFKSPISTWRMVKMVPTYVFRLRKDF
jgi:hypothetical protein